MFDCIRQQFLATQFLDCYWQLLSFSTQIRFPTEGEHQKCHRSKLINSLGSTKLTKHLSHMFSEFSLPRACCVKFSWFEFDHEGQNDLNFQCRVLQTVYVTTHCYASIRFEYTSLRTVPAKCVLPVHTKGLVPASPPHKNLLMYADLNYTILTWAVASCVPMILSSDKLLNFTQVSSLKECLYEKDKKETSTTDYEPNN